MKKTSLCLCFLLIFCLFPVINLYSMPDDLPEKVIFRTNTESFNNVYYAAARNGSIWVKPNVEQSGITGQWQQLALPSGLSGNVTGISMDDEHIIALNGENQIYTMWNALDDVTLFRWQKEWGFPFWEGPGMKLRSDMISWDFSVVSPRFDENYTDPAGNLHPVGLGKCSHIWLLTNDGQRLTYVDPWLPTDYSYELPTPARGRFKAVSMSVSGSFIFLINKYGDMYTRFYDFDIGGADGMFMNYSYYNQSGKTSPAIQLPSPPWVMHPKISGTITGRISIHKIGRNCIHRVMRVEGTDSYGTTGYYEKDVTAINGPSDWVFHRTDQPLAGPILDNRPNNCTGFTLGKSEDNRYSYNLARLANLSVNIPVWKIINNNDWAAELMDFSCYNSPVKLRIHISSHDAIDLVLHTSDAIRLLPRERGLDNNPRVISATIEIPSDIRNNMNRLSDKAKKFLSSYLLNKQFVKVDVVATSSKVRISGTAGGLIIWWEFYK